MNRLRKHEPSKGLVSKKRTLGARRAPPLLRSNTLNFMALQIRVGACSGLGPEFEKGDGRLRPSLQQRLPGAEGPPEGCSTAPRHAACGGPFPARGPALGALSWLNYSRDFKAQLHARTNTHSSRSRVTAS